LRYLKKEINKIMSGDKSLVAYCGLYCGACRKYLAKKCSGCRTNEKLTWCKIRTCCVDNKYNTCADCTSYKIADDCKKFNNLISKIFSLIFKSDRNACIAKIKTVDTEQYANEMSEKGEMTIKK